MSPNPSNAAHNSKTYVARGHLSFFERYLTLWVFLGGLFRPLLAGTEVICGGEIAIADSYIAGTLLELCKRTAFWFPREPEKATLLDPRCLRS